eukprot:5658879-Pleurochrysis_carterae.AAC.1
MRRRARHALAGPKRKALFARIQRRTSRRVVAANPMREVAGVCGREAYSARACTSGTYPAVGESADWTKGTAVGEHMRARTT